MTPFPPGYKSSPLGPIPEDWNIVVLKDILIEGKLGGNYKNTEEITGISVIKMGNIGRGNIQLSKIEYLPENVNYPKEDLLQRGDLLFNTRNTLDLVGKVAVWKNELPCAIYNSNLYRMKFVPKKISSNFFMNYLFNSKLVLSQLRGFATGTTSVAAIYGRDLEKLKLPIPSIDEQKTIVAILSTIDTTIQQTGEIIQKLEQRNKGVTQQLLTGKKRLPGFNEKWNLIHIGDFSQEISIKNKNNKDLIVLSCTKHYGLIPSLEYFGKKIYSDNLSTYKIVPKNTFAYATNHIEEGSIGYQGEYEQSLISPMYTIFKTDNSIDDNYLYKILKTPHMIYEYQRRMEGSIDRRGGLRWKDFSHIKIKFPKIKEQEAIAKILDKATQQLDQYKQKLKKLQLLKKGLMQQLLTGKIRVKL